LILDKSFFYAKASSEANLGTIAFKGGGELVVSNIQTMVDTPSTPGWYLAEVFAPSLGRHQIQWAGPQTAILESLVDNDMPVLDKEAGALCKDLDANKLSTALELELSVD
jgi:hypothetical protein